MTQTSPILEQPARGQGGEDQLTASGVLMGAYLALFLSQFDLCMLRQERIQFATAYPLVVSLIVMGVAIWYMAPRRVFQVLRGSFRPLAAFALIALLALAGAALPDANFSEGWKYILYPSMDFMVFATAIPMAVVFSSQNNWRCLCGLSFVGIVGSIFVDARYPGTFSFLDTRAAGFGVNPNTGAALTVMLLIGMLNWRRPGISAATCLWFLIAFGGVFLTMSRSGIVMLGLVGICYFRLCVRRNGVGSLVVISGLAFCLGGYLLVAADAARKILPLFEASGSRANLFSGQFDAMDAREDSRLQFAREQLEMGLERPLTGWGTGQTYVGDEGSHNMFISRFLDNGVLGVLAYVAFILAVYGIGHRRQSWECKMMAIYLAALSLFSHNLLEDKSLLLMMAISVGRAVLCVSRPVGMENGVLRTGPIPYPAKRAVIRAG